jgi:hypothetical protein
VSGGAGSSTEGRRRLGEARRGELLDLVDQRGRLRVVEDAAERRHGGARRALADGAGQIGVGGRLAARRGAPLVAAGGEVARGGGQEDRRRAAAVAGFAVAGEAVAVVEGVTVWAWAAEAARRKKQETGNRQPATGNRQVPEGIIFGAGIG